MDHPVAAALAALFDAGIRSAGEDDFRLPHDPEFTSPAEVRNDGEWTWWQPVPQSPPVDFSGLANAIEAPVHSDIIAYYSSFWAGTLEARSEEGQVSLIQLWNPGDFDRLVGNLLGHYMAKQRLRQPYTIFFANTEPDSEYFLSVDNTSGAVLLEEPGKPPLREVESDLATFLKRLTAVSGTPAVY